MSSNNTGNQACLIEGAGLVVDGLRIFSIVECTVIVTVVVLSLLLWFKEHKRLVYLRNRPAATPVMLGMSMISIIFVGPLSRTPTEPNSYFWYCSVGNFFFLVNTPFMITGTLITVISFRYKALLRQKIVKSSEVNNISNFLWFAQHNDFAALLGVIFTILITIPAYIITYKSCPELGGNECIIINFSDTQAIIIYFTFFVIAMLQVFYIHKKLKSMPDPFKILTDIKKAFIITFFTITPLLLFSTFYIDRIVEEDFQEKGEIKLSTGLFVNPPLYFVFVYLVPYQIYKAYKFNEVKEVFVDITLSQILDDETGQQLLKRYMIYSFTAENLAFLNLVRNLKTKKQEEIEMNLLLLHREFIEDKRLNVSVECEREVHERVKRDDLAIDMFDKVYCEVYQLVAAGTFNRFKLTEEFQTYVGLKEVSRTQLKDF